MKRDETRRKFIEGTICVIAREGIDKATTKQIGLETSLNEAYIYRCFADKEDMFARTFDALDDELVNRAMELASVMYDSKMECQVRCRYFFFAVWEFLLQNRERCLTYIRYYYSPYFFKYSAEDHQKRFAPLVNKIKVSFKEEADVWLILNHVLNVMFDFAIKVHNGHALAEENYSEHVFRVVYASIKQYFKEA